MFLFESLTVEQGALWFVVLFALIGANELARRSLWASLGFFLVLPLFLTAFVWPSTAGEGSSTGTWFHWAKVYSSLAGCLGFLALRFVPGLAQRKGALYFPPLILAVNILEAVVRDFQVYGLQGMVDGVFMVGGPWNIMNGVAGILNILTICGWCGIFIAKTKEKDMVWPDMVWPWIIAYDIWNFAYVYNCVGDHAFYAGAALLVSCTVPAFLLAKGAWLQHRAQTLALWMMFTMAVPGFVDTSQFAVKASHDPVALFAVSALALAANSGVVLYQLYRMRKHRVNPFKGEAYAGTRAYKAALEQHA